MIQKFHTNNSDLVKKKNAAQWTTREKLKSPPYFLSKIRNASFAKKW